MKRISKPHTAAGLTGDEPPRARVLFLGYGRDQTRLIDSLIAEGCEVWHTDERLQTISDFDAVVSFGYRHILRPETIASSAVPIINLHISYLPWNRGAHPNFWSFFDGTPAGVTIHLIDAGVDTGPILFQRRTALPPGDTTFAHTYRTLINDLESLFEENIEALIDGAVTPVAQTGAGSHRRSSELPADFAGWDATIDDEIARLGGAGPLDRTTAVLVLAHLMDERCVLNDESRGRADLAISVASRYRAAHVVTSGWDYRPDSDTAIASVMKAYIDEHTNAAAPGVIAETASRDTVGDAVFFKANVLPELEIDHLHVVTSDYHLPRTREIFEFFLGKVCNLTFHGAPTPDPVENAEHEHRSVIAFRQTFSDAGQAEANAAVETLRADHPFYNGQAFPSITLANR